MIDFRKKGLPIINFEQLKDEAIKEWRLKEKEHLTLVAKQ